MLSHFYVLASLCIFPSTATSSLFFSKGLCRYWCMEIRIHTAPETRRRISKRSATDSGHKGALFCWVKRLSETGQVAGSFEGWAMHLILSLTGSQWGDQSTGVVWSLRWASVTPKWPWKIMTWNSKTAGCTAKQTEIWQPWIVLACTCIWGKLEIQCSSSFWCHSVSVHLSQNGLQIEKG